MSERRRFRDRSQRPSGGGQVSGIPPQHNRAGPVPNGNVAGGNQQRRQGGGGGGGGGGQRPNRPHRQNGFNGHKHGGGGGGGGGGRQEPAAPMAEAGVAVEGLLQFNEERGDGTLRDVLHPLRMAVGNAIVPRSVIRDLNLRPGVLVRGVPRGRTLDKIDTVEGRPISRSR